MKDNIKELVKALIAKEESKTSSYDTKGIVKRIEGKKAFVRFNGSKRDTPVDLTINANVGDTVQVRVGNKTAWLTGNLTAPPTDDKKANQAISMVTNVVQEIQETVDEALEDVSTVDDVTVQYCLSESSSTFVQYGDWSNAPPTYVSGKYYWTRTVLYDEDGNPTYGTPQYSQDTQLSVETDVAFKSNNNHFWHDSSGAYVTTANKNYSSGYATRITSSGILQSYNNNLLSGWTNSGIAFYAGDGTAASNSTQLASFGASATIGKLTDTNISILASGSDSGIKMNVRNYYGTSNVRIADMGFDSTQGYETSAYFPKGTWYTFGYRGGTTSQRGYYSLVNGFNNIASHNASVAFGIDNGVYAPCGCAIGMKNVVGNSSNTSRNSYDTSTTGNCSLAVGYELTVTGQNQLVVGSNNSGDTTQAIIVGNGSNVFTVSKNGAVTASSWIDSRSGGFYAGGYKLLTTGTVSKTLKVSANSTNADTVSASKPGYKAIGIIGKQVTGSSSTFCHMYTSYMDSSSVIHIGARNFHESNEATMDIVFYVLYISSTQGV